METRWLTGDARWALWMNPERLTDRQREQLAWIAKTSPALHRAWALKEGLRTGFAIARRSPTEAVEALDRWISWARRCRLMPLPKLMMIAIPPRARAVRDSGSSIVPRSRITMHGTAVHSRPSLSMTCPGTVGAEKIVVSGTCDGAADSSHTPPCAGYRPPRRGLGKSRVDPPLVLAVQPVAAVRAATGGRGLSGTPRPRRSTNPAGTARFLYLATMLDLHSRRLASWMIADHIRARSDIDALRRFIEAYPACQWHQSDHFTQDCRLRQSMIRPPLTL